MKKGDRIRVSSRGRTLEGRVLIASENDGQALMLWVDGGLPIEGGILVGLVPVLRHEDGVYYDIVSESPISIERLSQ